MIATALVLLMAAVFSLALTPIVRNAARARGLVDSPDGRRKLHAAPVPRIGGLAVFLSFALSLGAIVAAVPDALGGRGTAALGSLHLVIASAAVMLVGLADDLRGVRPWAKLLVQAGAAVYLYVNGYQIQSLSNPFGASTWELGPLALPVTLLWFVGMSNAFNLIDGLDGLAAGVGLFSTTTLFIAALINGRLEAALLATALAGALLGFLRYNFNPASIFLGDSGSLFVGFALAAFALRSWMKSSAAIAVAAPLLALALPILDATIAVTRRAISGKPLFDADGDHIHHRLVRMGFTPRRVVILLYAVAAAFGALSLLSMTERSQVVGLVVIASSVVTWIGIQQLGYSEFGEVRRVLVQGFSYERQVISNNVYLRDLTGRFARSESFPALWDLLLEAAIRLEFETLRLQPAPRIEDGLRGVVAASIEWRSPRAADALEPSTTWNIPLVSGGEALGALRLTRSLLRQPPFDSAHLVTALGDGFAPRLRRLAAAPAVHTEPAPRPAEV